MDSDDTTLHPLSSDPPWTALYPWSVEFLRDIGYEQPHGEDVELIARAIWTWEQDEDRSVEESEPMVPSSVPEISLGKFLRVRREANCLSIEEIALRAAVPPHRWEAWEADLQIPSAPELLALGNAIGHYTTLKKLRRAAPLVHLGRVLSEEFSVAEALMEMDPRVEEALREWFSAAGLREPGGETLASGIRRIRMLPDEDREQWMFDVNSKVQWDRELHLSRR
ncbi:MAG: helix-turn-helix transcriptional regulator [Armatimonadetes bacterium]|nr:helix-turn-helix transcriptional regulator [Armatimonadota bacterium]